ncbi:MAG TPA: hypothetical protein VD858_06880 [Reyranella sp.]|nr:hypothetical protein [Reyranella sp.]
MAGAAPAPAHDANSWGGLFRSRDDGGAWLSADAGLFVGAALALAVSPTDANHLLYGTDTRLLRSRNAGRDWVIEAPLQFHGPTLAVAFAADGERAWAATPAGVLTFGDAAWHRSDVPEDAIPGRALAVGMRPGRVYLLGAAGLYASSDHGRTFDRIGRRDLPDAAGSALLMMPGPEEALFAVFDGRVWASFDEGGSWAPRDVGRPPGRIETIASDPDAAGRLWAASSSRLYVSDDLGVTWHMRGGPIGEGDLTIRGMAATQAGSLIVLATHKGLLRSHDGGYTWNQVEGALPVHLEAGPLLRDPHDAQTIYSGFSLVPYAELRRRAEQGANLLSRLDPVSVAGAAAFMLLLLIGGWWAARSLAHAYRDV